MKHKSIKARLEWNVEQHGGVDECIAGWRAMSSSEFWAIYDASRVICEVTPKTFDRAFKQVHGISATEIHPR